MAETQGIASTPAAPPEATAFPAGTLLQLPNGMVIVPQSRVEAEHFYEDLFERRIYLRHGITLEPGDCVFDVGGNIGTFTLFAHWHAPGARIYTFEPAPPLYRRLCANLALNGADARTFPFGIAEAERTLPFTFYPNTPGMSSFHADAEEEREVLRVMIDRQRDEGVEGMDALMEHTDELLDERFRVVGMECRVRPLSAVIREEGVESIDLLKIDVQKAELDVLRGIDDEDWPRIRQIVMEVHDLDGRLDEVTRLLEGRGFGVAVEQDQAVEGSILYNLFAVSRTVPPRERDPLRGEASARPAAGPAPEGDVEPGGVSADRAASAVFLFPGVGEQYPGMARGLYETEPVFRAEVDRCAELLRGHLGFDVREMLFAEEDSPSAPPSGGGIDLRRLLDRAPVSTAAARLNRTEIAQPVAFAVGYALARLWESRGVRPAAVMGHSLGEYTAACAAGVFTLEDALELVALRARAIQALPAGAMLAVSLSLAAVRPWLRDGVALAVVNAPELCVLSGAEAAIEEVAGELARAGHAVRRLAATHAFHSPLMEPVAREMAELAGRMRLAAPRIPLISNVTGRPLTADEATDPGHWARHLTGTVQFAAGAAELLARPGTVLVELGPGGSLGAFVRQQAAALGVPAPPGVASLPHAADDTPEPVHFLRALGQLWTAGVDGIGFPIGEGGPSPLPADLVEASGAVNQGDGEEDDSGEVRAQLAEMWRELLGVTPRPEDDFFALGGHSLVAAQLINRVRDRFAVEMRLRTLFQTRTLAALARWIATAAAQPAGETAADGG